MRVSTCCVINEPTAAAIAYDLNMQMVVLGSTLVVVFMMGFVLAVAHEANGGSFESLIENPRLEDLYRKPLAHDRAARTCSPARHLTHLYTPLCAQASANVLD